MTGLPVLDLTRFRSAERDAFLDDLRRAARDVGFFTVVGHGIAPELTARLDEEVLLHQDDVGGLQVQVPGTDEWLDAAPVPDGYVVNIGEMLEVATRGYLTATRHRVASPPPGVDRYSVPFFLGPRLDAVVEPVDLPPELAAETTVWDPNDDPDNPLLAAYGENALVGWLRSHPTVAARYWS